MSSVNIYNTYQQAIRFVCDHYERIEDEEKPEVFHALDVGFELLRWGYSGDIVVAAFLHDIADVHANARYFTALSQEHEVKRDRFLARELAKHELPDEPIFEELKNV